MLVGVVVKEHWGGGLVARELAYAQSVRPSRGRAWGVLRELVRRSGPPRVATIERRRLLRLLSDEAEVPVVLLSASAGYGKSILASQWWGQCQRPAALLSLDHSDNDPGVLLKYVYASERHTVRAGSWIPSGRAA